MEAFPAPPAASPEVPYPTDSRWMSDWLPSPLVPPEQTQILWGHNIHFRGWGIRGGPGGKRGRETKVGRALRAAAGGAALWFRVCLPAIAVEPRLFFLGCECDNRIELSSRLSCQIVPGQGDAAITPHEGW